MRVVLPIEGYDRAGRISVEDFRHLHKHEDRMKQWVEENLPDRTVYVEIKTASAFSSEIDTDRYNWCLGVWLMGDNHIQDAVWFKLTWGGTVLKRH